MHHSFQSTSYGVDRKPSTGLACVRREADGTRSGPITIDVLLHRLMTMLPTDYSMCDQDNDLMARSDQSEFVECTNANPLLDFCLDDLTHKERDALESELNLAACLQQALLPRHDSSDPGWQICYHYAPAGLLSGDYCDFFESNSGLFFLLGDVSGKGVAASMLKSHLHATFRSLADSEPPWDIMVEAANPICSQHTFPCTLATLVVGRAERNGGVELVSAAHPPVRPPP